MSDLAPVDSGSWRPSRDETFVTSMGAVQERVRDGRLELALKTAKTHGNLSGIVHGGVVMTLFDRVIGANCRLKTQGAAMATASLTVNFLSPISIGDRIVLSCNLRKVGRRVIFADAFAFVGEKLVATATGIFARKIQHG